MSLAQSPDGRLRVDTLVAHRADAAERADGRRTRRCIGPSPRTSGSGFDPLDCDLGAVWDGSRPEVLVAMSDAPWRTAGDTVERIEALAAQLVVEAVGDSEAIAASSPRRKPRSHRSR